MREQLLLAALLLPAFAMAQGGVGINNPTPDASALLDLTSTNRGFLLPRMTTAQRNLIPTPATSLLIFNNTTQQYEYYNGVAWVPLVANNGWGTAGNAGTNPTTNFLGTTDNQSLAIRTNNTERLRILNTGNVGVGTATPDYRLSIETTEPFEQGLSIRSISSFPGSRPILIFNRRRGTPEAPLATSNADHIGSIYFTGFTGSTIAAGAAIEARATSTFQDSPPQGGASLLFSTATAGIIDHRMIIQNDGNVGIGEYTPTQRLHVNGSIRMVDGNQAAGRVMVSSGDGTASWVNASTTASGTLDQAYDFGGAGAGRTIVADAGAVQITGVDGFLSTGTLGSGTIPATGVGPRMMWYPRKAAFRAGNPIATQWDDANIGIESCVLGSGLASGLRAIALSGGFAVGERSFASGAGSATGNLSSAMSAGQSSGLVGMAFNSGHAYGDYATAWGQSTFAEGSHSTAFGLSSTASGIMSIASGRDCRANGTLSIAGGFHNIARSYGEIVLGIGAADYTPSTNGATQFQITNSLDRLLVIGNAIDANNNTIVDMAERRNALVILKNGNTAIGNITPTSKLDVDGQIRLRGGTPGVGRVLTSAADGTATWQDPNASAWGLNGNAIAATNFIGSTNAQPLVFRTNNVERMRITPTGQVGIGTIAPAFALTLSTNSAAKPGSDAWFISSDARLKRDISPFNDGLDLVRSIDPIWYTYTGEAGMPQERFAGALAQDIQRVAPYMVRDWTYTDEEGRNTEYLGVDYGALNFVFINAIKEQQDMIEALQAELARLRTDLEQLRKER